MTAPLLRVRDLHAEFATPHGVVRAVDGVDLDVEPGECLGIVGESGCGKTVTFLGVLGLVRPPGRVWAEAIEFEGRDLRRLGAAGLRAVRGRDIAVTMQDALNALNPAFTVGTQLIERLV
jgi:ABC-type dipeptide/oligopeptide/nickel transport system ATPase component